MSYLPSSRGLFTDKELSALDVSSKDLRELPPGTRVEYRARHHEVEVDKARAFWDAVAGLVTLAGFLGVAGMFRSGNKKG